MKHCRYCGMQLPNGTARFHREGNVFCDESHANAFDVCGDLVGDSESNNDRGTLKTPHLPYVGDWGVERKHD